MSGRDACAVLAMHGFVHVRQRGSHIVMQRKQATRTTTVIVPDHPERKTGTLSAIIRQSGLERNAFEA